QLASQSVLEVGSVHDDRKHEPLRIAQDCRLRPASFLPPSPPRIPPCSVLIDWLSIIAALGRDLGQHGAERVRVMAYGCEPRCHSRQVVDHLPRPVPTLQVAQRTTTAEDSVASFRIRARHSYWASLSLARRPPGH